MSNRTPFVTNCIILGGSVRKGDRVMGGGEDDLIIDVQDDGSALLYLDRYLIAPLEMFTLDELEIAKERYFKDKKTRTPILTGISILKH